MTAAPRTDQKPSRENLHPRPVTSKIRWLIALSMALAIVVLFGAWAFLAERAKQDVRADHAAPAAVDR